MKKRILSFLMIFCLICSFIPSALSAEEEGLIQLTTPINLIWNVERWQSQDGTLNTEYIPGYMSWKAENGHQNHFRVRFYKQGESTPIYDDTITYTNHSGDYFSDEGFLIYEAGTDGLGFTPSDDWPIIDSGIYYFTVQSIGDGTKYRDSEESQPSEFFEFKKSDMRLNPPTNLYWDGATAKFDPIPSLNNNVLYYTVEFYYSQENDVSTKKRIWSRGATGAKDSTQEAPISSTIIQRYGQGYYWFQTQTLSANIFNYHGSEWSQLSPAYHLTNTTTKDSLDNILADSEHKTIGEIRKAVQDLTIIELKSALLTDQNESDAVAALLTQLEEKTDVIVTTTAEKPEFEDIAAETQIIGAALNDVPEGTDTITLNIGSPQEEHVIPEQYHNTVAFQFSMGLDGVVDQENLKVPVRITLPIPSTINPDFLILLHYSQDGSVEEIEYPYKFQKDEKWYVSIVLTHFSDFVMTEEKQIEPEPSPTPVPSRPSSPSSSSSDTYPITPPAASDHGTVTVSPKRAESGDKVTITVKPDGGCGLDTLVVKDRQGKELKLTLQEDGTYTFIMPNGPVTINAQFFVLPVVEVMPPLPFVDVPDDADYRDSVVYVYENDLMNGTSENTFEPETETSRAMLVTILHRIEGKPTAKASSGFTDVPDSQWYSDAVSWAVEAGIITGFEDNTFRPEELVTKEHLITILYRYADYKGYDTAARESLEKYLDRDIVSPYAQDAMSWAEAEDLLNEDEARALTPGEKVRRRWVATMIMKFCENVIG